MASNFSLKDIVVVSKKQAMSRLGKLQIKVDNFQLCHKWLSFPYSVIKKYSQDQGGNQAVLVTYFGFLSLFPLLVAAMSITELSVLRNSHLKTHIIKSLNLYFPLVGQWLQGHIHAQPKAGLALMLSILLTIYGARGVANALQQAMNHIWQVPKSNRASGPKAILRSVAIIFVAGSGFIITGVLSAYGTSNYHHLGLHLVAMLFSLLLTFGILLLIFKLSLSSTIASSKLLVGSILAALGLQLIQSLGGFLITHELKYFSSLYGSIALVFVVLFWIYLQVRILLYATEVDSVRAFGLWPRSFTGFRITEGDKMALKLYVEREAYFNPPSENISVKFKTKQ